MKTFPYSSGQTTLHIPILPNICQLNLVEMLYTVIFTLIFLLFQILSSIFLGVLVLFHAGVSHVFVSVFV